MNLKMGSQTFINVRVPVLWGTRAIIQDQQGRLSVIDLGGDTARLEILGDKPAPGVEFVPGIDGFRIFGNGKELYRYDPAKKTLSSIGLGLPECEIGRWQIRVGSNIFSGNTIAGFDVGIAIKEDGIAVGAPLPSGLARLVV